MENLGSVWDHLRAELAASLTEQNIKIWINPLRPLRVEAQTLYLGCPNRFFMSWVREHYFPQILAAVERAGTNGAPITSVELELAPAAHTPQPKQRVEAGQIELPQLEVHQRKPLRFNQRFTFDRFVVGAPNQYAFSAAKAMAMGRDLNADSLYLLSGPGLGKSHLSQAIGQMVLKHNPRSRVFYLTAEDFTNELIYSLKNNCTEDFKNKYRRQCDVLVLEEVNFLSGKEKVQAELSYTLDNLIGDRKKVIFTSSKLPKDIPRLGRQFSSRLTNSLFSTIEPPDYETRLRILERKALDSGILVADSVLEFLAHRITDDVRQMESSLLSLGAKSQLLARPIDLSLAEEALGDLIVKQNDYTLAEIQELVCRYYQVNLDDLRSRSRRKSLVLTRNVGMYLCRQFTDLSLEGIGKAFARNHSTVLYSINVIETRSRKDAKLKSQVEFLAGHLRRQQGH